MRFDLQLSFGDWNHKLRISIIGSLIYRRSELTLISLSFHGLVKDIQSKSVTPVSCAELRLKSFRLFLHHKNKIVFVHFVCQIKFLNICNYITIRAHIRILISTLICQPVFPFISIAPYILNLMKLENSKIAFSPRN